MFNIIFWSVISFFAAIGIFYVLSEIANRVLNAEPSYVLLTVRNRENDIEYSIRSLLKKYPLSEIIIADNNSTDATLEIAHRMANMYERVHIK